MTDQPDREPLTEQQIIDRTHDAVYRSIRFANKRGYLDIDDLSVGDVDGILLEGASMSIECRCNDDVECGDAEYAGCLYCRRMDVEEHCPKCPGECCADAKAGA